VETAVLPGGENVVSVGSIEELGAYLAAAAHPQPRWSPWLRSY